MKVGAEWLVDAEGCLPELLSDGGAIRRVCEQIIADLDLRVVGEAAWHEFPPPGGVTGLFLLTESHLACHTYPESGIATFNLYCCRERHGWPWAEQLKGHLGAARVTVRFAVRGDSDQEAAHSFETTLVGEGERL
ncbi:MAG TPA: S-adenosylmethionine decarboxylase [Blastocatellia bacterium]|nr:S-adenosylmethionine decarboxylase [Blastocatellia bacterium]